MTEQWNFVEKLFDTLKKTTDDNTSVVQKLVDQQNNLVGTVEKMPISDIRQELKDHVTAAHIERKDILDKVNEMSGKVKIMIGVVVAAVALTTVAYFAGRFLVDASNKKQLTTIEEKIYKEQEQEFEKLQRQLIETIRKELRKNDPEVYNTE